MKVNYYAVSCAGFLAAICFLGAAYYLQYTWELEPCSLCILQRVSYFVSGFLFLLGSIRLKSKCWRLLLSLSNIIVLLAGISLAIRQIWLQHLPPENLPACTPGLERLMKIKPLFESLQTVLLSGECGKVDALIMGLPMVYWSIFGLAILFIFACYSFHKAK